MTRRRYLTLRQKAIVLELQDGTCAACDTRVRASGDSCRFDHVLPLELCGTNGPENWQALCLACDRRKTYREDIPNIAKAKRRAAKHNGTAKKSKRKIPSRGFQPRLTPYSWPSRKMRKEKV